MNESLSTEPDAPWERIAEHLDDALVELSEPDRDALILRYFEKKSLREVGERLGVSDDAAQKRVPSAQADSPSPFPPTPSRARQPASPSSFPAERRWWDQRFRPLRMLRSLKSSP